MNRRANGEGSVVQRKDGRWQASVMVGGRRITTYGKTRKEAFDKLTSKKAVAVTQSSTHIPTLSDYIDLWLSRESKAKSGGRWRTSTLQGATISAEKLKSLPSASLPLDQVNPFEIRNEMQGWSTSVLYSADKWLRSIYNDAVIRDVIPKSQFKKIAAVKQSRSKEKTFCHTKEEALRLIMIADDRLANWLTIAYNTGLRPSELRGLNVRDIQNNKLHISRQRSRFSPASSELKTESSKRAIAVAPKVIESIKALAGSHGWLVQDGEGYSQFCNNLKKACLTAEVPIITWHKCRHSHATWLLSEGVSVHIVSSRLGHADIGTTLRIYAHVLPNDEERVIQIVV